MMPEKVRLELDEVMKLSYQRNNPDSSNHYEQMLKEAEALHLRDPNQEDVKDLRHFIPLFRKICYIGKDDIEKKFKLKAMWTEKPSDWPADVVHVDPNNPGSASGKKILKPKKPDLMKMFNHLTSTYKRKREGLWRETFGCMPDDETVDVKSEMIEKLEEQEELQGLAQSIMEMYGDKEINKLVGTLIKEFKTIDDVRDPKRWVVYNRQKSILEADLREAVYLYQNHTPHPRDAVILELKGICRHMNINPEDVLSLVEEDKAPIPLILESARSPTSGSRKRKPTFTMEMEEIPEQTQGPVVPVVANNPNFNPEEECVFVENMDFQNNINIESEVEIDGNFQTTDPNSLNYIYEGLMAVQALEQAYPQDVKPDVIQQQQPNHNEVDHGQPFQFDSNPEKVEPGPFQWITRNISQDNEIPITTSHQVTAVEDGGVAQDVVVENSYNIDFSSISLEDINDILWKDVMLN